VTAKAQEARELLLLPIKPLIRRMVNNDEVFYRTWLQDHELECAAHMILPPVNSRTQRLVENHDLFDNGLAPVANTPVSRQVHLSSGHGASNSASLAAVISEFVRDDGVLRTSAASYAAAVLTDPGTPPKDTNLRGLIPYSQAGFGTQLFGPGWIGWAGAGGSLLIWHLASRTVMCYVPTRFNPRPDPVNGLRLRKAVELDLRL